MATTQTISTTQLPDWAKGYYQKGVSAADSKTGKAVPGLIPQAFDLYGQGKPEDFQENYVDPLKAAGLFGTDRIADVNEYQMRAGEGFLDLERPDQFADATKAVGSGIDAASGLPSLVDPGALDQYMTPYAQSVIDINKQEAIRDAQKTQLGANLRAAKDGVYGGSRQLLAMTERERNLGQGLADIQSRGMQSAYEAAQKGLESERSAKLEQAKILGDLGQDYGQIGVSQQQSDIDRLKGTAGFGDFIRGTEQQELDTRFFDLMKGLNYPEDQLEKLNAFIRGIPATDKTEVKQTPITPLGSQLVALGLGAIGAGGNQQSKQS